MTKWLFLLRAFVPSWRFFTDAGPELRLEMRAGDNEKQLSEWRNCLPPIRRTFWSFPLNPTGNYLHACHSLLRHLNSNILDSHESENIEQLTTYKIVHNLVRTQISRSDGVFQFRLSLYYPEY